MSFLGRFTSQISSIKSRPQACCKRQQRCKRFSWMTMDDLIGALCMSFACDLRPSNHSYLRIYLFTIYYKIYHIKSQNIFGIRFSLSVRFVSCFCRWCSSAAVGSQCWASAARGWRRSAGGATRSFCGSCHWTTRRPQSPHVTETKTKPLRYNTLRNNKIY